MLNELGAISVLVGTGLLILAIVLGSILAGVAGLIVYMLPAVLPHIVDQKVEKARDELENGSPNYAPPPDHPVVFTSTGALLFDASVVIWDELTGASVNDETGCVVLTGQCTSCIPVPARVPRKDVEELCKKLDEMVVGRSRRGPAHCRTTTTFPKRASGDEGELTPSGIGSDAR